MKEGRRGAGPDSQEVCRKKRYEPHERGGEAMKTKAMITVLVSVAMILTTPLATLGAGPGGGGGTGGGTAQAAGALYGDLYVIERDGNGAPVLKAKTINGVTYICQQPIAADCTLLPLNYHKTGFNAELEDPCAVQCPGEEPFTDYMAFLQGVTFGRESVSRAPATVLDKSYGEALKSINLATPGQCKKLDGSLDSRAVKLDPAGRITLCLASETLPVTYGWKTIDAPLENLGLYRAAMTNRMLRARHRHHEGRGGGNHHRDDPN